MVGVGELSLVAAEVMIQPLSGQGAGLIEGQMPVSARATSRTPGPDQECRGCSALAASTIASGRAGAEARQADHSTGQPGLTRLTGDQRRGTSAMEITIKDPLTLVRQLRLKYRASAQATAATACLWCAVRAS